MAGPARQIRHGVLVLVARRSLPPVAVVCRYALDKPARVEHRGIGIRSAGAFRVDTRVRHRRVCDLGYDAQAVGYRLDEVEAVIAAGIRRVRRGLTPPQVRDAVPIEVARKQRRAAPA